MMRTLRSALSLPQAYQLSWNVVGGRGEIKVVAEEYVRPEPGCRILDIGCGPGTLVPYLPRSEYVGIDVSSDYIESARKRFPDATFICERVSNYKPPHCSYFDIVLAMGVVHHLDDAEALRLFQIAHEALKTGGKLVTVDGVFTKDQSLAAHFLLTRDRGGFVRNEQGYVQIASKVFTTVKATIRNDLLWIPYTHIIMECISEKEA
jgi:SAM-dependent methyltransferase